jgi:fumarate reductase iron-sulfur subunit
MFLTRPAVEPTIFLNVSIWRGSGLEGDFSNYQVPHLKSQTILDVVSWVQRNVEPKLTYRFACRVGMCGSCAMMVNGRPVWTCRTHVDKVVKGAAKGVAKGAKSGESITIEPLRNLPVIKDLACDMSEFFEKWQKAEAKFHPTKSRNEKIEAVLPDSAARKAADKAIECINCGICYSACDVVANNREYLGPAALNRAWTLINDQRDGGRKARLGAVSDKGGCHNCHSQQGCSNYCPNELNPTLSIAGLKRETLKATLTGEI